MYRYIYIYSICLSVCIYVYVFVFIFTLGKGQARRLRASVGPRPLSYSGLSYFRFQSLDFEQQIYQDFDARGRRRSRKCWTH